MTLDNTAAAVSCSTSRLSRIESGTIRPRGGDVMELLTAYGHDVKGEPAASLLLLTRDLKESGWWQRMGAVSNKYATFIAYEADAVELRNYEPTLVPGLLQTEAYAREVNAVGRETEKEAIDQLVTARLRRQEVLHREPKPLRLHAIISEAALYVEVGGPDVLRQQLEYIVHLSALSNVSVQVLRFMAGAHLADRGGFQLLAFEEDPPLGYIESLGGSLFLESDKDFQRLRSIYDHLSTLAMSPAESIRYIRERAYDT